MPIGFPKTEDGSDIKVLKHLFSPEEAEIATYLRFGWERDLETIDKIYERVKESGNELELNKSELEEKLDQMVQKGLLMFKNDNGTKRYGNALLMVGMFEFQVKQPTLSKEFLKDFGNYFDSGWLAEAVKVKGAQLRTIPIEKSLDPEMNVNPYDDIKTIINKAKEPYAVIPCICKQAKDLLGSPCKITNRRDVCLAFDFAAKLYLEQGWARKISKEEVIDILEKNQEEGLVLQPDNSQKPTFLCSCCSCCCESLSRYLKMPRPADLSVTNYFAEVDDELCIGCGACVEICPMEAIKLKNEVSTIKLKRCIGCGNCIAKCPEDAIHLKKREKQFTPFPTMDDLFDKAAERKARFN
jgi:ferredoxin